MVSSVQFSCSVVSDSAAPRITAHQASLSITNSQSSLKLTSIELVMPSSYLILGRPLLLLPSIPPSIRVFSNESTLRGEAKSCLDSNPIPTRDACRAQTKLCVHQDPETLQETEQDLPLRRNKHFGGSVKLQVLFMMCLAWYQDVI